MKKAIRIIHWTCSDFVHHEHRWYWGARLCGRVQRLAHYLSARVKNGTGISVPLKSKSGLVVEKALQ